MKKKILQIVTLAFIVSALCIGVISVVLTGLTSCKPLKGETINVAEVTGKLNEAGEGYAADVMQFRKEAGEKIATNIKNIIELETRVTNEKRKVKADYDQKIIALHQKNAEMKKTMDDYKAIGEENWEFFKISFAKDMGDVEQALKSLTAECLKK